MARFFEYPINYIGNRTYSTATPAVYLPAAQDNNFSTSTGETTIDVFIDTVGDGSGDAQAWTALFVKCKGIASYDVAVTDGNIVSLNVTIPTNLPLYNTPVTDLRGFQNHFICLQRHDTGCSIWESLTVHDYGNYWTDTGYLRDHGNE